jgi:hypothetical protein
MAEKARFDLNTIPGLSDAVSELLNEGQRKRDFVRVVPNIQDVSEGEFVPYDDGTNRRIYTKINGTLYYISVGTSQISANGFVDRGDPAASDYTALSPGNWIALDLSGIVPAGAKSVVLRVGIGYTEAGKKIMFRKKGNVNAINISEITTQVANGSITQDVIVACDDNRMIEYKLDIGTIIAEWVIIKGWWL